MDWLIGKGLDTWAIDGFIVHSSTYLEAPYFKNEFQLNGSEDNEWLIWFGGKAQSFCSRLIYQLHSILSIHSLRFWPLSSIWFFLETRLLHLAVKLAIISSPLAILSFHRTLSFNLKYFTIHSHCNILSFMMSFSILIIDRHQINVGCDSSPSSQFPVRLEYSTNGGMDWRLVSPDPYQHYLRERMSTQMSSVYYSSTSGQWRRETLRLSHLDTHRYRWVSISLAYHRLLWMVRTNRSVQIRWNQGYLNESDRSVAPHWALRNIFIGHCYELCNGHGSCTRDGTCSCDAGYHGYACELLENSYPNEFHETFHGDYTFDESVFWNLFIDVFFCRLLIVQRKFFDQFSLDIDKRRRVV